ncbi:enoyl-CoA hydratase/isomerase family protein [Rhizobiaceae bacterium]|nr:enoyl-CoA hydratase/isomerase family protein [Rhizobiaceae bacterium]
MHDACGRDELADIHFARQGRAGIITLDRQHALNAVSGDMLDALAAQLDLWEKDADVELVVVRAAPGRAFSAGGDIRHLYESIRAGQPDLDFFAREYRLNVRIAEYPKPYVALIDGIVMGGGVGVSFHGSHVVVGPDARFAMPEVGIGFFPDVGASYLLSRIGGEIGLYLGLTGSRIGPGGLLWSGLATHGMETGQQDALVDGLATQGLAALDKAQATFVPGDMATAQLAIRDAFGSAGVPTIMRRLSELAPDNDVARLALERMQAMAPLSLAIAYRQIREGEGLSLRDCMAMEYRIVSRVLAAADFAEGIRASVIDKDGAPQWSPATLALVDEAMVSAVFAALPTGEGLWEGREA